MLNSTSSFSNKSKPQTSGGEMSEEEKKDASEDKYERIHKKVIRQRQIIAMGGEPIEDLLSKDAAGIALASDLFDFIKGDEELGSEYRQLHENQDEMDSKEWAREMQDLFARASKKWDGPEVYEDRDF